jgi:ribulose-5-phosphate 4-epimerase/fuculose-1-phosphate aldolase
MSEAKLREEICRIGASLYQRGLTVGTAGNISARLDDGFLITPTDACLGYLDPAKISKLDANGEQVSGDRASKTIQLHRVVYETDATLRGIVHAHSTHLVALSLMQGIDPNNILVPLTPYHVMKAGKIPLIRYHRPGAPDILNDLRKFVPHVRGVMLQRIGPTFWHNSVEKASFALEEAEETAKLFLLTRGIALPPLSDDNIVELKRSFDVKW